jgi:hypothetical protein
MTSGTVTGSPIIITSKELLQPYFKLFQREKLLYSCLFFGLLTILNMQMSIFRVKSITFPINIEQICIQNAFGSLWEPVGWAS